MKRMKRTGNERRDQIIVIIECNRAKARTGLEPEPTRSRNSDEKKGDTKPKLA